MANSIFLNFYKKNLMWIIRAIHVSKLLLLFGIICFLTTTTPRLLWDGWQILTWLIPCTNQKAVLYYVAKYCTKAKTKTVKLDKFIKDLLLHIFSKNSMGLLVIKFINKLIGERDISGQKTCHFFLQLNLTSSSCLIGNMNV